MDIENELTLILSDGIPASLVLQAIHDGLFKVNEEADRVTIELQGLESLMTLIREDATSASPSGAEVTLARGGFNNLNARLDDLLNKAENLAQQVELSTPRRETRTRTEVLPYRTTTEYNSNLLPSEGYIKTVGKNGSVTVTYEEEFINNVSTGRIFNERETSRIEPINEVRVVGTKVINPDPIRYIRLNTRQQGTRKGHISEFEVWVNGNNIAKNSTVLLPTGTTQTNQARMFDGVRGYAVNEIEGNNSFVQIDLKQGYTNIQRINFLLYPTIQYDVVRLDVSSDGKNWKRVHELSSYKESADNTGTTLQPNTIYGEGTTTYFDDSVTGIDPQNVSIGGMYRINKPLPIYWDSDNASIKNPVKTHTTLGLLKVINKRWTNETRQVFISRPNGNAVALYGTEIGWFRDDENRV